MRLFAFFILTGMTALVFILMPEIDIGFAQLFYEEGRRFFPRNWPPILVLHVIVPYIVYVTLALVMVLTLVRFIPPLERFRVRKSVIAYIVLSLALGPLLISNIILKDNMGRARPAQTEQFGGYKKFTPALVPSAECPKNCSFVSGHAATGFFLVTFAFLMAPGFWRRAAITGAVSVGTIAGLARMAEGAHYLSDVVFAGLINFAVAWALYHLMVAHQRPGRDSPIPLSWRNNFKAWGQAVFGNHGTAQFNPSPPTHWATPAAVFAAVMVLGALCYLFVDRPFAEVFGALPRDTRLTFRAIALPGNSFYWLLSSSFAFAILWLASRHPRLAGIKDRLKAWSMLPLFLLTSVAMTGIVVKLLKIAFGRARPIHFSRFNEYGFSWFEMESSFQSFPSGHAVTVVAILTVFYFIMPRFLALYILVGTVVALSRAAAMYHYPSDIFFGGYIAIMMTAWLRMVFVRSGVSLTLATLGCPAPKEKMPWSRRLGLPDCVSRLAAGTRPK